MHSSAGYFCLLWEPERVHLTAIDVRTCNIVSLKREFPMSAQDLPATARALSVVVAIALVATALAPLIFTAVRVVA
jgi:hypothetical protein